MNLPLSRFHPADREAEPMRYGDHAAVLHVSRRHTNGEPESRELAEIGWAMRRARSWTRQNPGDKCKVLWGGREVYVRNGEVYRVLGRFR